MANGRRFARAAPIPLRSDFTADDLRAEAKRTRDANQARRLLALAAIYDGGSRSDVARIGGVGLQIFRDWVVRFNTGGPAGLIDRKAPGAALVLPRCTTEAMNLHLAEIALMTDADAHAVVLLDQAGWHTARALAVPDTITLMPLPAHAPDLNPVETIWRVMRDTRLSNRVFDS